MRAYIDRHFFGTGALAVVVVALCLGWPDYDGAAQADNAADDAVLKVRTCIGANDTSAPLEEALIKKDIIEEDLLQTKVTRDACKDMLDSIPDGSPARKFVAAQNYIQELELIVGVMDKASDEAATRGTDRDSSSDESLNLFQTIAQTSEQAPALAQYNAPKDGGGGGTEGIKPTKRQAVAAAGVGEDTDASIAHRLRKKEAALKKEGASATEAAAGGRCSLEVNVLDEELDKELDKSKGHKSKGHKSKGHKSKGMYEIEPLMPKKMQHEDTKQAGLLVLPATKERFQEIRQKHDLVGETSESDIGCVKLTDRMSATLMPDDPKKLGVERDQPDDVRKLSSKRTTKWNWYINAHQTGKLGLVLDLRYAISKDSQDFRAISKSPIYDGAIKVKPKSDSTHKDKEESVWQIITGIF
jgi:hypothetical protein